MPKKSNALTWIIKEAKHLKRKFPRRFKKWTDYVAQASAVYKSKHGSTPVGHKRATKKRKVVKSGKKRVTRPRRRRVSGSADQPYLRTGAAGNRILSGVGSHNRTRAEVLEDLKYQLQKISNAEHRIKNNQHLIKLHGRDKNYRRILKKEIANERAFIRDVKKTITLIKKHLK